jgi:hypothetical protein
LDVLTTAVMKIPVCWDMTDRCKSASVSEELTASMFRIAQNYSEGHCQYIESDLLITSNTVYREVL